MAHGAHLPAGQDGDAVGPAARRGKWVLEYEPATPREPDPLMGWASARDTLNQVRLRFATLEEAKSRSPRSTASTTR